MGDARRRRRDCLSVPRPVRRRRTKSRRVKRRVGIRCGPGMESQRTSATRRRRQRRFPTCRSILGSFDPAVSGSSIFRSCGSLDVARQVAVHVERRGVGWSQVIICTFYMLEREARPSPFRGPRLADRQCRPVTGTGTGTGTGACVWPGPPRDAGWARGTRVLARKGPKLRQRYLDSED